MLIESLAWSKVQRCGFARLFPLERSQRVLNLVILRVLGPDIIVDTSSLLQNILAPKSRSICSAFRIAPQPTL